MTHGYRTPEYLIMGEGCGVPVYSSGVRQAAYFLQYWTAYPCPRERAGFPPWKRFVNYAAHTHSHLSKTRRGDRVVPHRIENILRISSELLARWQEVTGVPVLNVVPLYEGTFVSRNLVLMLLEGPERPHRHANALSDPTIFTTTVTYRR